MTANTEVEDVSKIGFGVPQTCRFTSLPREIRDQIYAYALHSPSGLQFYRQEDYKAIFCQATDTAVDFNSLKFVCHQIRCETLGLEFQLNELKFSLRQSEGGNYMNRMASIQFYGFLDMCSEVWRQRIRCVRLHDPGYTTFACADDPGHIQDLHNVVNICENYPKMTVLWHIELQKYANAGPSSFMRDCLMFATAVRPNFPTGRHLRDLNLEPVWCNTILYHAIWRGESKSAQKTCYCWGRTCGQRIQSNNFRVVPFDEPFDQAIFQQELWKELGAEEGKRDVFERHCALAKRWSQDGF